MGGGHNRAVWPDKKSVSWTKDFVEKFRKEGQLVMEKCAATFSVANACMKLPLKHRRLVSGKIEPGCFNALLLAIVENFGWEVLVGDSDAKRRSEVFAAAWICV